MPDYFNVGDRLYEVTGFGSVDSPGFHFECWDLAPDGGGLVGTITVPATDGPAEVTIGLSRPLPLAVLLKWMALVPEIRDQLADPGGN
jgi:hypothetical protein